ncbi:MAG: iron-containing alcohol dehydrogenase, partial [Chloroflexota bacterium]
WHAAVTAGAPPEASAAARAAMSWAACCSGIALASAGLGAVHGIVAAVGAAFPVPHGTGCGILLAATTRANMAALLNREPGSPALARYAEAGRILAGDRALSDDHAREALQTTLDRWTTVLRIPRLADFGATPHDLPRLVAQSRGTSMRTNPVALADAEIAGILAESL